MNPPDVLQRARRIGFACALVGAVLFAGKGIIVKLAYRHDVDAVTLIMLRMLFALPLFLLMAWWAGRGKPALPRRELLTVAGLGFCGYYLSSFLDFIGLQYVSASLERLILYLSPTIVLLMGWWIYGRRVSVLQLLALGFSYAGVLLVFGQELRLEGRDVLLGSALVFASMFSYAVYLIVGGEVVKRLGAMRLTGLASTVACLLCIAQYLLLKPVGLALQLPAQVLWLSLLNGTVCTAAPVLLLMLAIERVGPEMTSQIGMVGPVSTVVFAVWLLGEPFTLWTATGTVLVIAGVALLSRVR